MDEVVSKWGIGQRNIPVHRAGVAQAIFTGTVNWNPIDDSAALSTSNPPAGTIPKTILLSYEHVGQQHGLGGVRDDIALRTPIL
jgi:preprotein translocase subunit SecY